jgi:hypothetical protein
MTNWCFLSFCCHGRYLKIDILFLAKWKVDIIRTNMYGRTQFTNKEVYRIQDVYYSNKHPQPQLKRQIKNQQL